MAASPISLCPVPKECGDATVQNATRAMNAAGHNLGKAAVFFAL